MPSSERIFRLQRRNAEYTRTTVDPGLHLVVELRQLAGGVSNPESVATIAWLGYEAPGMNLDVADDAMAKAGAGPLNDFYKGLDATTNVPDQQLTAFGHSYGSLTTSLALQDGAPVGNVVLYGSPGGELTNASQLGVAPGHAYFMDGVNDGVPTTIAGTHSFGPPLSEVPGFTELSVNSGAGLPALMVMVNGTNVPTDARRPCSTSISTLRVTPDVSATFSWLRPRSTRRSRIR